MIDFRYPLAFFFYGFLFLFTLYRWTTKKQRKREVELWGNKNIREHLFSRISFQTNRWKSRLSWWGLALLIFASTGPQIGTKLTEVQRKGVDILVALDISSSMKAEDVKPSRLEKAKFEISRLISRLEGDRIGLIVFAGTSHLYLPLTSDYDAAKLFVDAVDVDMIQVQGTAISDAVKTAISSFPDEETKHKVLIVVTDGEDHEGSVLKLVEDAAKTGIVTHSIGVGTTIGSLIPVNDDLGNRIDYKKNRTGKLVTTTLKYSLLQELATTGNGLFIRFDNQSGGFDNLFTMIQGMEKRTLQTHEYSLFEDRYQIFALIALLFLMGNIFISNRRKGYKAWHGRFV